MKSAAWKATDKYPSLFSILHVLLENLNDSTSIYRKIQKPEVKCLSNEESLSILIDGDFSKAQYQLMRMTSKKQGEDLFPTYNMVRESKRSLLPERIEATSTKASVSLFGLTKITIDRIVSTEKMKEIIESHMDKHQLDDLELKMIYSWGMDGSSGNSRYHQATAEGRMMDDNVFFTTSVTPLSIVCKKTNESLWKCIAPQSIRFVRLLCLEFTKETKEHIINTNNKMQQEIKNLPKYEISLKRKRISFSFEFYCSSIDGKVLNALTDNANTHACPICGKSSKSFNKKENLNNGFFAPKHQESLKYNVQPLHCIINTFNNLLNISYRLKFKKAQARGDNKTIMKSEKIKIQSKIKEELHILVDMPKDGGAGNTTTGNICRRAFNQPQVLAQILNLNVQLVENISIILSVLNYQEQINNVEFKKLCDNTFNLYIDNYDWYPMTPSLHKILVHSTDVILTLPLPPAMFSEEGAEACNKIIKHDRLYHARKNSRTNNIRDIFMRRMISTTPDISEQSIRSKFSNKKRRETLPKEIQKYLIFESNVDRNDEEMFNNEEMLNFLDNFNELDNYNDNFQFDEFE